MTVLDTTVKHDRMSEKGNVLFLILIAVALFAALSYAVTQSTRSGGGDASKETNLVNAAGITQYPASVKTAITRMVVSNATDPDSLLFNPPSTFSAFTTTYPATNGVFHPTGGGATYADAPASVMQSNGAGTWHFNGENQVTNIGTSGALSTSNADVIAFLSGVKKAVCDSIHTKLGIPLTYATLTGIDVSSDMNVADPNIDAGGGTIASTELTGQPQGCFQQPANNYVYYHVLVER
ncbi:MAG TPA: hypothetical protein DCM27_08250 [Rhodospirillaceae bacterium]|nr:hypothetical protein [Rhodospirillaceae bacterium]